MLKHWDSHAEYQHFISQAVESLNPSQLKKFSSMSDSLNKLTSMNLDPVGQFLAPYYSNTGRPAINQPQILRSFILMLDRGFTRLTNWIAELASDDLLAILIGCAPDSLPPLGSYFDFINRLWLQNPSSQKSGRKDLFPENKNKKPSSKPGKGKKLPNRHPGITKKVAAYSKSGRVFPFHYEKLLQQLFSLIAVVPSMELGLIPASSTVSGDGTCVHSHANPYGHKVCNCQQNGIYNCTCDRHYSDPDASWGWDSDLNSYFFGHTLYMLSCHNEDYQLDLPLHIHFLDARRHDSISGIVSLTEFRHLNPGITIQNLCFDSANDNYPTYEFCKEWGIQPFIDLNDKTGPSPSLHLLIRMVPLCVLPVFGWSIGDMTPTDTAANGVVRQPVGKWTAVPAKIPVPTPLMADASIPNLIGISAFILQYLAAQQSIKRFTITAQVRSE